MTRESDNNMYSISAYYLAQSTSSLMFCWFYPFITAMTSFWFFGFDDENLAGFFMWSLSLSLVAYSGVYLGLAFGANFTNVVSAVQLMDPVINILNFGSGIMINLGTANIFVKAITIISPLRYGTELLYRRALVNEPEWF